jgi:hypothetical protein
MTTLKASMLALSLVMTASLTSAQDAPSPSAQSGAPTQTDAGVIAPDGTTSNPDGTTTPSGDVPAEPATRDDAGKSSTDQIKDSERRREKRRRDKRNRRGMTPGEGSSAPAGDPTHRHEGTSVPSDPAAVPESGSAPGETLPPPEQVTP